MLRGQLGLFGCTEPEFDASFARLRRIELGRGAWLEYAPNWLRGDTALFEHLARTTRWQTGEEHIYDKVVPMPRLYAVLPEHGPGHPVLRSMQEAFTARYGQDFCRISMALYRDGRDSVAWHGDRVARRMDTALMSTISIGAPRRFLVRPYGGGRSVAFDLGLGDLLVMGGTCQRTFQHCVPKVARAEPRIAIMFRPPWKADEHAASPDERYGSAERS